MGIIDDLPKYNPADTSDEEMLPPEKYLPTISHSCRSDGVYKFEQPTRLEVIDANGRTYTNWKVKEMEFSYQDDGRTLKIFIKESE